MGVLAFYLFALVPVIVGAVIWYTRDEVVWQEWLIGAAVAFLTAFIVHMACVHGMTTDTETWSGQISRATFYPRWVEEYTVIDYCTRTDADGRTETYACGSHTEYRTHYEHWEATVDFGRVQENYDIDQAFWEQITVEFKDRTQESTWKPGFYSGDPDIYVSYNRTGFIFPATTTRTFENRVKAAPSLFSFSKVPEDVKVYPWPETQSTFESGRLLGTAANLFDLRAFDQMNARLGPVKKVNVILVGFVNEGSDYGHMQEAAWIGGKKNDLVLTFGGMTARKPAQWAYVFGWTENDLCKRNLETLLLSKPASTAMLKAIEQEVKTNYEIKDWTKFDYITVEPPAWSYYVYFAILIVTQTGLYVYFHNNEWADCEAMYAKLRQTSRLRRRSR